MRGHDIELLESFLGCFVGIAAFSTLSVFLKFFPEVDENGKFMIGLLMLYLGMSPVFFLIIERHVHEKVGRSLRWFHAICAVTVLIASSLALIGIILFSIGVYLSQRL